ncbi:MULTISPECIES: NTP transferase domain-containing protein [Halocynthiibacter]|uniref:Nucleotidyltransferase family protein n=1 Tax=Halocynthiibacter halioticoli TaxID=2986804 RepID=A0AAE3J0N0_9RHOB|nr:MULTISPECIES: nucleotidyltransferase family protein [Halocynthiibacter]MCV6824346.1 nucleotidyltransferase family protein [Halocynthiibacter halioticoli]MCW4057347.1 nucleotidyltransferase family protein [Halocynthiibacter sp. SDUM655004]
MIVSRHFSGMTSCAILIPAAGASRRMGDRDKLLEPVFGEPILRRVVKRAQATGALVIVTVPALDHPRMAALKGVDVVTLPVPDAATGMAASFRVAQAELPKSIQSLLIALPDMPDITGEDMALMLNAFTAFPDQPILRAATEDGRPGHPVLLPNWCFKVLSKLEGDTGAKSILKAQANRVALLPLCDERAIRDLDTPENWAAWRKANPDA